jgi:hypothetical protein
LGDAFEDHGRDILETARQGEPARLWMFVSDFLAWDEAIDLGWDPSDEDLDRLAERIVAALRTAQAGSCPSRPGRRCRVKGDTIPDRCCSSPVNAAQDVPPSSGQSPG